MNLFRLWILGHCCARMTHIFGTTFILCLTFPLMIATSFLFIANNKSEYLINIGHSKKIVCDAKGDPIPSIIWKVDGNTLGENTFKENYALHDNASLFVTNHKSSKRYGLINATCIVNNTNGTAQKLFKIWLIKAPRILTNNSETNINYKFNTLLLLHISCETTGYPNPDIEWRFGNHVRNASQDALLGDTVFTIPSTGVLESSYYKVFNNGTLQIYDLFSEKHLKYRNFTCVAQNIAGTDNRTHTFEILTSYKFEVILPMNELIGLEDRVDRKIRNVFQSGKLFHSKNITSVDPLSGAVKFDLSWKEETLQKYYDDPIRNIQQLANDVYRALNDGGLHPVKFIMNAKPAPPVALAASEIKSESFTLSWEHPDHFIVTFYQVEILEGSNNKWKNMKQVDGAQTSTILNELEKETKYQLRIFSINNNGLGEYPSERLVVETKVGSSMTIIIIIVVLVIIAMLLIPVIIHYYRRRKKPTDVIPLEPENPYHDAIPGVPFPNIYIQSGRTIVKRNGNASSEDEYCSWKEIPRNNLTMGEILGRGEFGLVAKALWRDDETNNDVVVAVKTVQENATETDRKELFKELQLMADIAEHPNVVNLLGACSQGGPLWVAVEFCAHGNLLSYLKKHRKMLSENEDCFVSSLDPLTRVMFAFDVCKGMSYLAQKKIIHRDLAARNVLLGNNNVAKVSDFGLSRDIYEVGLYQKTSGGKLPVKWMAIESIQDSTYTSKSDVWSFGVMFWEIEAAGMVPYPGVSGLDLRSHLLNGYRLHKPDETLPEIYELMMTCWKANPKVRPSFNDLNIQLESFLENMTGYLPVVMDDEKEHAYVNYAPHY